MSRIKFALKRYDKFLVFQVLEMDERFRAEKGQVPSQFPIFKTSRGTLVNSANFPEINEKAILLRGYGKGSDLFLSRYEFKDWQEAARRELEILNDLQEWSKNWQGWYKDAQENTFEIPGKISYRLWADGKNVLFQVLYTHPKFRGCCFTDLNNDIVSGTGMNAYLGDSGLNLHGKSTIMDDFISVKHFANIDTIPAYTKWVHNLIETWANNWSGFDSRITELNKDGIYEF